MSVAALRPTGRHAVAGLIEAGATGWACRYALLLLPWLAFAAERPNFIVIVADDMGYGDLACNGHPTTKTPHLDALAAEGARLTQFYSPAQVCSPTRVSMMTGRMPHRMGIYSFIGGSSGSLQHLPKSEVTLPQLLRKDGYQTAIVGKWHCSLNELQIKHPEIPTMDHYGFDYWCCSDDNAKILNKPGWRRNGKFEGTRKELAANVVGKEAVGWLRNVRDKDKPFIQFVHFYEPHWYVAGPKDLVSGYLENGAAKTENEAHYYAAISNVDAEVGRICKAVEELGLKDNTVIFFSSDHGPAKLGKGKTDRNFGTATPYRGKKYGLWDGSIHVPGIVRWPKRIKAGTIVETPAGSIDWLPTICDMSGTALPAVELDGQSHLPLLLGDKMVRSKPLQWHHYNTNCVNRPNPNAVMRVGDYVICGFYDPRTQFTRASWRESHLRQVKTGKLVRFALYNLMMDPGQEQDLSDSQPKRLAVLREQLQRSHKEMQSQAMGWRGLQQAN
jgi:arylsulfatase A